MIFPNPNVAVDEEAETRIGEVILRYLEDRKKGEAVGFDDYIELLPTEDWEAARVALGTIEFVTSAMVPQSNGCEQHEEELEAGRRLPR